MKKFFALMLCITLITYNSLTASAYAYFDDYKLAGGIRIGYYWLNSNLTEKWSITWQNGMTFWNQTRNNSTYPTRFNFSKASAISLAQIICNQYSENDKNNGHARFFIPGKGLTKKESMPTADWTYSYVYLNTLVLKNDSYAYIEAVATHEIGHAVGLAHSSITNSIMCPAGDGRTATRPQIDDMVGLRNLYNYK